MITFERNTFQPTAKWFGLLICIFPCLFGCRQAVNRQLTFEQFLTKTDNTLQIKGTSENPIGFAGNLLVAGDLVYSAEANEDVVRVYDRGGNHIRNIGRSGSGPGEFRYPFQVVLDDEGRLFVHDRGNYRIQIFSPDFEFVTMFPIQGNVDDIYLNTASTEPTLLAVGIVIHDQARFSVQEYSLDGHRKRVYGPLPENDITVNTISTRDRDGRLYVTRATSFKVRVYDENGEPAKTFELASPSIKKLDLSGLGKASQQKILKRAEGSEYSMLYGISAFGDSLVVQIDNGKTPNSPKPFTIDIFKRNGSLRYHGIHSDFPLKPDPGLNEFRMYAGPLRDEGEDHGWINDAVYRPAIEL